MKILWICNNSPLTNDKQGGGAWFTSLANELNKTNPDINIVYCFPASTWSYKEKNKENKIFYCFKFKETDKPHKISKKRLGFFEKLLRDESPDIIHIWGSEFAHSLEVAKAAEKLGIISKVVLHIQGLCFQCADHMESGLPQKVKFRHLPKDFIIGSVRGISNEFQRRGKNEIQLLKMINNVIGRTEWDKSMALLINPDINYFECSEMLREDFYNVNWEFENCMKNSIFMSQASYPLKGLHFVLRALSIVKNRYPLVKLNIAGTDVTKSNGGFKYKISLSYYGLYINRLIKKYKLKENVCFLGPLNKDGMKKQYLLNNVYLLSSQIENSSNSLAEAMIVGIPCIASYVGGTPSILNESRGYLYQYDDVYHLAFLLEKAFKENNESELLSKRAKEFAKKRYCKEQIINDINSVYLNMVTK